MTATSKEGASITELGHPLYIKRLAQVYMEKHKAYGYEEAKAWYYQFIPPVLQEAVSEEIRKIVIGPRGSAA